MDWLSLSVSISILPLKTATIGITTIMIMPITIPPIVFMTFLSVSRATAIFFSAAPTVADIVSPSFYTKLDILTISN